MGINALSVDNLQSIDWDYKEGYVLRVADEIKFSEFRFKVVKFVRKGHIQTTKHWMSGQPMKVNGLNALPKV